MTASGTAGLAKRLLNRTLGQFKELKKGASKGEGVSARGIHDWFIQSNSTVLGSYVPGVGSMAGMLGGYEGGRHQTVHNLIALRMWMGMWLKQHKRDLPKDLQDTHWGVPSWYSDGMQEQIVGGGEEGVSAALFLPPLRPCPRTRCIRAPGMEVEGG